jgi:hypothetical protein
VLVAFRDNCEQRDEQVVLTLQQSRAELTELAELAVLGQTLQDLELRSEQLHCLRESACIYDLEAMALWQDHILREAVLQVQA